MTKHKSKRKRIALIATLLVVAGLGVWYVTRPKASAPKVSTIVDVGNQNTDELNKNDPTLDQKTGPTTTPAAEAKTLNVTVSRPVNNDKLPLTEGIELRSVVSGATSGTCTLALAGPSGRTLSKTSPITAQPSYGSCSFDVPGAELAAGQWSLALTANASGATGKTSLKVTVQ